LLSYAYCSSTAVAIAQTSQEFQSHSNYSRRNTLDDAMK
jgi:hypothetical protein